MIQIGDKFKCNCTGRIDVQHWGRNNGDEVRIICKECGKLYYIGEIGKMPEAIKGYLESIKHG